MYYIGLDIHSKRIAICILNETGQVVRRCQVRTIEESLSPRLTGPGPFTSPRPNDHAEAGAHPGYAGIPNL
jgi:hypothetical protein